MTGRILVGAALLLAGGTAALALRPGGESASPRYETATVVRGDLEETVSAFERIGPRDYVDVGAQASGQLLRLHVAEGDRAARGDLLAEIDPTTQLALVDAAQAAIARLEAVARGLDARARHAKAQAMRAIALSDARVKSADAVDAAHAEAEATAAEADAVRAEIRETRARLRADEAELGYTRIYAPMTGTVVAIDARPSQTLVATYELPRLLRVADLSVMTVSAQVAEADVPRLRSGMPVWFTTLGHPDRRWRSSLRQILPAPVRAASGGNDVIFYTALFDVPNEDGALLAEMSAQVFFVTREARDALVVPMEALAPGEGDRALVRVLDPEGAPELRDIRTGLITRFAAEAVEGLAEGERVVIGETTEEGRSLIRLRM